MKRSILTALALCAATALTGFAHAQADSTSSSTSPSRQSSQSSATGGATSGAYSSAGHAARLSKLMNTALRGATGQSLGQVQDVIADPTSGQIQFVVLSVSPGSAGAPGTGAATTTGTGLGDTVISSPRSSPATTGSYGTPVGGGKLVAVPWRMLTYNSTQGFTANVDAAKLQNAPSFSNTAWPTMDATWMQRVYSHFGVDATGTGTGAPGSNSGSGSDSGTGTSNPSTPGLPSTPGTPDITPPGGASSPSGLPGSTPNAGASGGSSSGGK